MYSSDYCTDCKRSTEVVFDHSGGDAICSECGLVLESHSIDETSEWRVFASDSDNHNNDPVRVGGPTNPLLSDGGGGLSTFISKPNNKRTRTNTGGGDYMFAKRGAISNPDRGLIQAFEAIDTMADRLDLVSTIKDRACEIYKKVEDQKSSRGRNQDVMVATCLLIACRKEGVARSLNEICLAANGVEEKDIGQAMDIFKQLGVDIGNHDAGEFLRRFCSKLGMNDYQTMKAAEEAFQKSKEIYIRGSPTSIAAAIIFQILGDKKALRDISLVTGVAEGTIRKTYKKEIYPRISKIIPSWFSKEEDLKNLCPVGEQRNKL